MAPTAIKEKLKSNLELWAIGCSIIAMVVSPAAGYIAFKVGVESFQQHTEATLASQEQRISVLEAERITIARALGRLEEQSTQNQRTLERIETNLARSR